MHGMNIFFIVVLIVTHLILDQIMLVPGGKASDEENRRLFNWGFLAHIIFVCFTFFDPAKIDPLLSGYAALMFGLRACIEWVHLKETRSHFVSLLLAAISIVFGLIFEII
ncbi:hypothetical protein M2277_006335 [Paenibacillus sp. LBL]|uniref:DUF4181 domain-containing protein n=1 Tax=Paenibacillus sp. LBL TaxID=2940563 RepID=UPI0024752C8C|nr:DUF4181 domain-containing protein [Paenibacillus sp. LBL]MDH6675627.1 hypothetical protein [Paenibacillus sp. LBL]